MSFEKEYYEDPAFWENEMLQDEANKKRIEFTVSFLPDDVDKLADIGCGNGVFVNHLKNVKPELDILAMDRSEKALDFVKTNKIIGDISSISLTDKSYKCVTCLEVIEHLPFSTYEESLKELARISNKYIIVSVPYNENLEESHNQCPYCKSIFNLELHLRRFTDNDIDHLFDKWNFKFVKSNKLGKSTHYKGHYWFRRIFYKEQFRQWKSPICPVCGYNRSGLKLNKTVNSKDFVQGISAKQRIISLFTWLPKKIWPRYEKYYWIIALYERI